MTRLTVIGVCLALMILAGAWGLSRSTENSPKTLSAGGTVRTKLLLCVSADPALSDRTLEKQAVTRIKSSLERLSQTDGWRAAEMQGTSFDVESGCPGGYVMPPTNVGGNSTAKTGHDPVVQPSRFALMVYLVGPNGEAELRGKGAARAAREMMCEPGQHVCSEVTTALFLSPDVIQVDKRVDDALTMVLGLESEPAPIPTEFQTDTK